MDLLGAVKLTAPENKHMKLQHMLKQIDTKASDAEDGEPTLMLCNIPCSFGREDIVAAIDSVGLAGLHDHVQVPLQGSQARKHRTNKGYAFVHCKTPEAA